MNKKIRVLAVILAALMMLCLCACGDSSSTNDNSNPSSDTGNPSSGTGNPSSGTGDATASEIKGKFEAMSNNMKNIKGLDASLSASVEVVSENVTMRIPMQITMQVAEVDEKTVVKATVTATVQGQTMKHTVYSDGTRTYYDDGETKYYVENDPSSEGDSPVDVDIDSLLSGMDAAQLQELLGGATITTEGGNTKIEWNIPAATLKSLLDTVLSGSDDSDNVGKDNIAVGGDAFFGDGTATAEVEPTQSNTVLGTILSGMEPLELKFSVTLNKDNWLVGADASAKVKIAVPVEDSSVPTEMTCSVSLTLTINNPGQAVTVTPPADLNEYVSSEDLYI